MTKNLTNDEIDLIEIFQIIWKKKNTVILSIVISLFLALLIQISEPNPEIKKKVNAITEIKPIKIVDQSKYQVYNSILKIIKPIPLGEPITYVGTKKTIAEDGTVIMSENKKPVREIDFTISGVEVNNITKKFLLEMFVEAISERSNLKDSIIKFNLIKEENYPNKIEYENAISKIVSDIRILNLVSLNPENELSKTTIEYETYNIERWESFLKFLEVETNRIIQTKLVEMFDNYLTYTKMIKNFKMEDLEFELITAGDDEQKMDINKRIIDLESNKYAERIAVMFNSSPMANNEEFYAAKINYDSTKYVEIKNYNSMISLKTLYGSATLLGAILGIFFVLIANAVQKRS